MEIPRIDLNTLLRSIYPGLVLTGLLYLCPINDELISNLLDADPFIIGVFGIVMLAFGILFYAFYRGILYFWGIRHFEKLFRIPQYDFHCRIVDELAKELGIEDNKDKKRLRSIPTYAACESQFVSAVPDTEHKASIVIFNAFVHVLMVTASLFLFYLVFYLLLSPEKCEWCLGCLAISSLLLFASGITVDYFEADTRIAVLVSQNRKTYVEIVRNYYHCISKPASK